MILFQSGTINRVISIDPESEIGPITSETIIAAAGSMSQLITSASIVSGKNTIADLVYMY
jgi:hypothetical protein